jgi:hypothetical protein
MRTPVLRAFACLAIVCLGATAPAAQEIPPGNSRSIDEALKLRVAVVDSIRSGTDTPDEAIAKLKGDGDITGLNLDPDANFAYGIIDVGQRLVALSMPTAADPFFKTAELTLAPLVQRTPDKDAPIKAQYLRKLSILRSTYLGQFSQAMQDIDQAIALQPEDRDLQLMKRLLADSTAALGKTKPGI